MDILEILLEISQELQPHALTASAMETLIMIILKLVIRRLVFVFSVSIIHLVISVKVVLMDITVMQLLQKIVQVCLYIIIL
jgi:hypothetical protein